MTTKTKKTKTPTTTRTFEPEAEWTRNRVAAGRVLTKKKNRTPTADATTLVVLPVEEDHAQDTPVATPADPPQAVPTPSALTLKEVAARWLDHMRGLGKTQATVASYRGDLEIATTFFGESAGIPCADETRTFDASDAVTKTRAGRAKAKPTVLKTRRALRLAITWAASTGLIDRNPYAATP